MGWVEIREQAAAILSGVSGSGVVHQYDRWATEWEKMLNLFKIEDAEGARINAQMISRFKVETLEKSTSQELIRHYVRIRCIYGLKDADASEHVFQAFINNVMAAFRANYKLNDTCSHSSAMQAPVIDMRSYGGVLCHHAELTFAADTWEAWS